MPRLILMRHAKSDWPSGIQDHNRPLNARGRRSAAALGAWMREKGHVPVQAFVSSARRTRETWAGLHFPDCPVTFHDEIYEGGPADLLDLIRSADTAPVILIGHNPVIGMLAQALLSTPPAHADFARYPTGATTVIDLPGTGWSDLSLSTGTAIDFTVPRDLTD